MEEINQIKSQLKDKGINPNGVLGKSIEKVILDLKQEIENLKNELLLHNVSQQRELLLAYEKSKCPETWWVSKRQAECEIEDFLANNCG